MILQKTSNCIQFSFWMSLQRQLMTPAARLLVVLSIKQYFDTLKPVK